MKQSDQPLILQEPGPTSVCSATSDTLRSPYQEAIDHTGKIALQGPHIREFREGPTAVAPQGVHPRDPVGLHGRGLLLRIFTPVALDLDDEIQRIVRPVTVVDPQDEVGPVLPDFALENIWDLEPEAMVLHVGQDPGMLLDLEAEGALPVAVEHAVVDVALCRIGGETVGAGVEIDVPGAALAATDPVSVIALFKELGASKKLTILMEGESLFNDGVAVVAFVLLVGIPLGVDTFSVPVTIARFCTFVGIGTPLIKGGLRGDPSSI